MKLKFKKQQFQEDAVKSVTDLFIGQTGNPSSFSINKLDIVDFAVEGDLLGYGNRLNLSTEEIEKNMHDIQVKNLLPLTDLKELRFNIEMETGTGKTFVYTKTIYELNKLYGFNKFVVLVPSVAIREGVYKSFQTTKDHFEEEYDGKKMHFFIYSSGRRTEVRDFALSNNLEVMIVNIDAIKKDENLFNRESDKMDKTAREYLAECNPIIIIDEPQSVDRTDKDRASIKNLHPMCELRYSATHKNKINTVYKLTPVDAYQMGIVKQICVANDTVLNDFNKPYVKLIEVGNKGRFYAKVEVDIKKKDGAVKRQTVNIFTANDLESLTKRDIYQNYIISNIEIAEGRENIEFTNGTILYLGQSIGLINEDELKKEQIRRTIESHLNNEILFIDKGIKVLSLFFIDEVSKYRDYEASDPKGVYAHYFEECYNELIEKPKYLKVKEFYKQDAEKVHEGYFSVDKKGKMKNTKGDTSDDISTYELIMKQKEYLLSFACPIRFIFSHSALKEGWDNPNVFQVCTLIENKTEFTCRQKIGRGLRLCVNQNGERIEDKKINILTVIARETFAEFAETLQKEIEEETGMQFGVLDIGMFVGRTYPDQEKNEKIMTYEDSKELLEHFRAKNYIDSRGKIKDTLKNDLLSGKIDLPKRFENAQERFIPLIKSANSKIEIKQSRERVRVKCNKEVFIDDKFTELWDRIKQKSYYHIDLRIDELLHRIITDIEKMEEVKKSIILREDASIDIKKSGVEHKKIRESVSTSNELIPLPDVVRILYENTGLPRNNIGKILIDSGRLKDFANNPQQYIEQVTKIINFNLNNMSIERIHYTKIEGQEYSLYEVFDNLDDEDEVYTYLSNAVKVDQEKSVYDYVVCDNSGVERNFAEALNEDADVQFFFKIPDNFKISTPIGPYNPDWAVYVKHEETTKMYFVIETKGSTERKDWRSDEDIKIQCGIAHFRDLGEDIKFKVGTSNWNDVKLKNLLD